jgi:hypothetical protein
VGNEVGHRLAPEGVDADTAGTRDGVVINRSTERITKAANAICLKDYSSFLRSKEAPPG